MRYMKIILGATVEHQQANQQVKQQVNLIGTKEINKSFQKIIGKIKSELICETNKIKRIK